MRIVDCLLGIQQYAESEERAGPKAVAGIEGGVVAVDERFQPVHPAAASEVGPSQKTGREEEK